MMTEAGKQLSLEKTAVCKGGETNRKLILVISRL